MTLFTQETVEKYTQKFKQFATFAEKIKSTPCYPVSTKLCVEGRVRERREERKESGGEQHRHFLSLSSKG